MFLLQHLIVDMLQIWEPEKKTLFFCTGTLIHGYIYLVSVYSYDLQEIL